MNEDLPLFPEQASRFAPQVDALYLFLVGVAAFFTLLIFALIFYFVLRYRRTADVNRMNPPTSQLLELSWAVIPFVITMVIFFWGAALFLDHSQMPSDADEIAVVGKQWMWKIQHANGRQEINNLHVPVGRPVRLNMISEDVIHSFYIPGISREARRVARTLYQHVVRGDEAWALPLVLRRVLRHQPLADGRLRDCNGASRLR